MRNFFKGGIIFFLMTFILMSCNSENDPPVGSTEPHNATLVRLDAYNDSLLLNAAPSSRGWFELSEAIAVVVSDAGGAYKGAGVGGAVGTALGPAGTVVGAVVGGAVVGAACSYSSYHMCETIRRWGSSIFAGAPSATSLTSGDITNAYLVGMNESTISTTVENTEIGIESSVQGMSNAIEVGKKHNIILLTLFNGKHLSSSSKELNSTEKKVLESQEITKLINKILKEQHQIEIADSKSLSDQAFSRFVTAVKTASNYKELTLIAMTYITETSKSTELTQAEKQALYNGYITACYSFKFWDYVLKDFQP